MAARTHHEKYARLPLMQGLDCSVRQISSTGSTVDWLDRWYPPPENSGTRLEHRLAKDARERQPLYTRDWSDGQDDLVSARSRPQRRNLDTYACMSKELSDDIAKASSEKFLEESLHVKSTAGRNCLTTANVKEKANDTSAMVRARARLDEWLMSQRRAQQNEIDASPVGREVKTETKPAVTATTRDPAAASPRNVEGALASPFYDPDFWVPRRPLAPNRVYHFQVVYNHVQHQLGRTEDTEMALRVASHLVEKLEMRGYVNGYYHDRDRRSNNPLVTEVERVIAGTSLTILVLTPGFLHNCLDTYLQIPAFRELLTGTWDSPHPARLVILGVGVSEGDLPHIIGDHDVFFFRASDWETDHKAWSRLDDVLKQSLGAAPSVKKSDAERTKNEANPVHCSDSCFVSRLDHVPASGIGADIELYISKLGSETDGNIFRRFDEQKSLLRAATVDNDAHISQSNGVNKELHRHMNKREDNSLQSRYTVKSDPKLMFGLGTDALCRHSLSLKKSRSVNENYFRLTEDMLQADDLHELGLQHVTWDPGGGDGYYPSSPTVAGCVSEEPIDYFDDGSDADSDTTIHTLDTVGLEDMRRRYGYEGETNVPYCSRFCYETVDQDYNSNLKANKEKDNKLSGTPRWSETSARTLDTDDLAEMRARYGYGDENLDTPRSDMSICSLDSDGLEDIRERYGFGERDLLTPRSELSNASTDPLEDQIQFQRSYNLDNVRTPQCQMAYDDLDDEVVSYFSVKDESCGDEIKRTQFICKESQNHSEENPSTCGTGDNELPISYLSGSGASAQLKEIWANTSSPLHIEACCADISKEQRQSESTKKGHSDEQIVSTGRNDMLGDIHQLFGHDTQVRQSQSASMAKTSEMASLWKKWTDSTSENDHTENICQGVHEYDEVGVQELRGHDCVTTLPVQTRDLNIKEHEVEKGDAVVVEIKETLSRSTFGNVLRLEKDSNNQNQKMPLITECSANDKICNDLKGSGLFQKQEGNEQHTTHVTEASHIYDPIQLPAYDTQPCILLPLKEHPKVAYEYQGENAEHVVSHESTNSPGAIALNQAIADAVISLVGSTPRTQQNSPGPVASEGSLNASHDQSPHTTADITEDDQDKSGTACGHSRPDSQFIITVDDRLNKNKATKDSGIEGESRETHATFDETEELKKHPSTLIEPSKTQTGCGSEMTANVQPINVEQNEDGNGNCLTHDFSFANANNIENDTESFSQHYDEHEESSTRQLVQENGQMTEKCVAYPDAIIEHTPTSQENQPYVETILETESTKASDANCCIAYSADHHVGSESAPEEMEIMTNTLLPNGQKLHHSQETIKLDSEKNSRSMPNENKKDAQTALPTDDPCRTLTLSQAIETEKDPGPSKDASCAVDTLSLLSHINSESPDLNIVALGLAHAILKDLVREKGGSSKKMRGKSADTMEGACSSLDSDVIKREQSTDSEGVTLEFTAESLATNKKDDHIYTDTVGANEDVTASSTSGVGCISLEKREMETNTRQSRADKSLSVAVNNNLTPFDPSKRPEYDSLPQENNLKTTTNVCQKNSIDLDQTVETSSKTKVEEINQSNLYQKDKVEACVTSSIVETVSSEGVGGSRQHATIVHHTTGDIIPHCESCSPLQTTDCGDHNDGDPKHPNASNCEMHSESGYFKEVSANNPDATLPLPGVERNPSGSMNNVCTTKGRGTLLADERTHEPAVRDNMACNELSDIGKTAARAVSEDSYLNTAANSASTEVNYCYYDITHEAQIQSLATSIVKDVISLCQEKVGTVRLEAAKSNEKSCQEVGGVEKPINWDTRILARDACENCTLNESDLVCNSVNAATNSSDDCTSTQTAEKQRHDTVIDLSGRCGAGELTFHADFGSDGLFRYDSSAQASSPRTNQRFGSEEWREDSNAIFSHFRSVDSAATYEMAGSLKSSNPKEEESASYSEAETIDRRLLNVPSQHTQVGGSEHHQTYGSYLEHAQSDSLEPVSPRVYHYNDGDSGYFDPCDSVSTIDENEVMPDLAARGTSTLDRRPTRQVAVVRPTASGTDVDLGNCGDCEVDGPVSYDLYGTSHESEEGAIKLSHLPQQTDGSSFPEQAGIASSRHNNTEAVFKECGEMSQGKIINDRGFSSSSIVESFKFRTVSSVKDSTPLEDLKDDGGTFRKSNSSSVYSHCTDLVNVQEENEDNQCLSEHRVQNERTSERFVSYTTTQINKVNENAGFGSEAANSHQMLPLPPLAIEGNINHSEAASRDDEASSHQTLLMPPFATSEGNVDRSEESWRDDEASTYQTLQLPPPAAIERNVKRSGASSTDSEASRYQTVLVPPIATSEGNVSRFDESCRHGEASSYQTVLVQSLATSEGNGNRAEESSRDDETIDVSQYVLYFDRDGHDIQDRLSVETVHDEATSPGPSTPRLTPRSLSNFRRLRSMHRQSQGLNTELGPVAGAPTSAEEIQAAHGCEAGGDERESSEAKEEGSSNWFLQVYKGVCHAIAKPDMPYMG